LSGEIFWSKSIELEKDKARERERDIEKGKKGVRERPAMSLAEPVVASERSEPRVLVARFCQGNSRTVGPTGRAAAWMSI
jgi:hypothetical protein